mgnify:CR=1 FL=1
MKADNQIINYPIITVPNNQTDYHQSNPVIDLNGSSNLLLLVPYKSDSQHPESGTYDPNGKVIAWHNLKDKGTLISSWKDQAMHINPTVYLLTNNYLTLENDQIRIPHWQEGDFDYSYSGTINQPYQKATQPTQPTQPIQPTQPTQLIKTNISKGTPVSLVNNKKNQSKNREVLPQTGEQKESSISVLGVLLLALGSLTSWLTFRKKRED